MNSVIPMTHTDSDLELLQRFRQSHDRTAFSEIVHRYGPIVFAVCRRVLGDFQQAEDAFQQTFLKLARHAHTIRRPEALPAWLYSTARRSALENVSPEVRRASLPSNIDSGERDPLSEITGRELLHAIDEEMASLPDDYRSAIMLCAIDGLSVDEAAQRLASTNGSVRGWLQRGRELLKKQLLRRGIEIPAALAVVFGVPSSVPAATMEATINASLGTSAIHQTIGAKLLSIISTKSFSYVFAFLIVSFFGWRLYRAIPKPELPPLTVAKWELTTETPLPKGAIARIGDGRRTLELGKKQIHFANADQTLVAVGDTEFLAWDITTGKQLHRTTIDNVPGAISPTGQWFVQLGRVFEAETGKLHWQAFENRKPQQVKFVADNVVALVFHERQRPEVTITLLDISTKKVTESTFKGYRAHVLPRGERVAVWDQPGDDYDGILTDDPTEGTIRIHSLKEPQAKPVRLSGFRGEPLALEFDAEGNRVFCVTPDRQLNCWNTTTGERFYNAMVLIPPPNTTRAMADGRTLKYFSRPELSLLTVSPKGDKVLWNGWDHTQTLGVECHSIDKKKLLWKQQQQPLITAYASFLFDEPRGRLIVNDQKIVVLDVSSGKTLSPTYSKYANRGPFMFHASALSQDGRLVAFCNGNIGLYDIEKILDEHAEPINSPETARLPEGANQSGFVPGSNHLVWGSQSNLSIVDIDRSKTLVTTDFNVMDQLVPETSEKPTWVYLDRWNLKWGELTWDGTTIQKQERPIAQGMKTVANINNYVGFGHPQADRYFTAIVGEGKTPTMTVTCWDPFTATQLWQVPFPTNPDVEISNTVTSDGRTYYPEFRPKRILLTADRKMVLVLTHTNLIILETSTGKLIHNVSSGWSQKKKTEFDTIALADHGKHFVLGVLTGRMDHQEVQLRAFNQPDTVIKKLELGRPGSYSSGSHNVQFAQSHDGRLIAVRMHTQGVNIFDWQTGTRKYHLPQVTNGYGLSFSANDQRLLAKEPNNNTALVWDLEQFAVK